MKTRINGKLATEIAMDPSPDGDDTLYRTASGEFYLEEGTTFVDGNKLKPWEEVEVIAPELDYCRGPAAQITSKIEASRRRVRHVTSIKRLSARDAMIWCIRTQIPECFRGYLLESIPTPERR